MSGGEATTRRRITPGRARRESKRARKARTEEILARLKAEYPGSKCALNFTNPLELLVATILSAQCTDERVNRVTPALFAEARTAAAMAKLPVPERDRRQGVETIEDLADPLGLLHALHGTSSTFPRFFRSWM